MRAPSGGAGMHFDESADQRRERLGDLLDRLAQAAFVFGVGEAVAAQVYRDAVAWTSAAVILGYGVVALGAARLNRKERTELACAIAATGLLLATSLLAAIQPELHAPLALVPLLAAVVAYPYLSGRPLLLLLVAVVLETASVTWLGEVLPPATHLPRWFLLFYRSAATATVVGLIAYFLWQHRSRLEERFRDEEGRRDRLERAIGELSERELAARQLSWRDPLTGLSNRRLGLDRLKEALDHPNTDGSKSALVFVDLDDFKKINDRAGHAFGDSVLVAVAEGFRAAVRNTDTLARFGGDEFFLVMPRVSGALDVEMVARRLLERLAARAPQTPPGLEISASLGLALAPDHGTTAEELLRVADAAMYRAKADGGARFRWAGETTVPEPELEDSGEIEAPNPSA